MRNVTLSLPEPLLRRFRILAASRNTSMSALMQAAIRDHVAGKTPIFESTHRMRHQNGEWRWVISRAHARVDDRGAAPARDAHARVDAPRLRVTRSRTAWALAVYFGLQATGAYRWPWLLLALTSLTAAVALHRLPPLVKR